MLPRRAIRPAAIVPTPAPAVPAVPRYPVLCAAFTPRFGEPSPPSPVSTRSMSKPHPRPHSRLVRGLAALLCALAPLAAPLADAQTPTPPPALSAPTEENAYVLPATVAGVQQPIVPLIGTWQFQFAPDGKWADIRVPSETAMQGFAIEHNKPYRYKTTVTIPADYAGKRVFLRFDGVYSHARLSVNGTFLREHHGGFTRWETDITQHVKLGEKNEIFLEVTDRADEISYASGYAHHPIGGILRDVRLFALPQTHLYDFYTEIQLDSQYKDAVLKIKYALANPTPDSTVEYKLTSPDGKEVPLTRNVFPLTPDKKGAREDILLVKDPLKWDAEHPNLYGLTVTLKKGNKTISHFVKKVGFREIKVSKEKLLVNGKPVKWRGADRHDVHPQFGRSTTPEFDRLDAKLFKEANMNYVRTSHYPPTEAFVEACDEYGIYVECESAVCFVSTHRPSHYKSEGNSQNKPEFRERYLLQFQAMIKTFRGHASVALWSLGNESAYGSNFQACYDWLKSVDTTRPVIFSYPGQSPAKNKIYDILSIHYPDINGNGGQYGLRIKNFQGYGIPVVSDEWAHPACYTYSTLQHDPNIREFWGQSLDKMWKGVFASPGALGGAIWGFVDDTFMLPVPKEGKSWWLGLGQSQKPRNILGNCTGYGEWGIVDVWRRKKPEFWSTKKAYSPVRLAKTTITDFRAGEEIKIPVENRFDHTNLNELKIACIYYASDIRKEGNLERFSVEAPSVAPHEKGVITLPAKNWKEGQEIVISFRTKNGLRVDGEKIIIGKQKITLPETRATAPLQVTEDADKVVFKGEVFEVPFDKKTGLLGKVLAGKEVVIENGPFLNLDIGGNHVSNDSQWKKKSFAWAWKDGVAEVNLEGTYGKLEAKIKISVFPSGKLVFDFQTSGEQRGKLRESGLKFYLSDWATAVTWKRNSYWSTYPRSRTSNFAGNLGHASLKKVEKPPYGERPKTSWQDDAYNYYYWANAGANSKNPLSNTAKGMKENIWYYQLGRTDNDHVGLAVVSPDASLACRLSRRSDEQLILHVNSRWDYPEIGWGNYSKNLRPSPNTGSLTLILAPRSKK
ncbi:MAG: hypothetical protein LBT53_04595 [Puniceicoccales bacterium]|jgi:beta-galactosidase/beta-glucuronidase|nr:hypothetical protein [Puniceicoccales bacterium]